MEHLEIKSGELWLTKSRSNETLFSRFWKTKARSELAITKEQQEKHKMLNGTSSLTPLLMARAMKPMIEVWNTQDPQKNLQNAFAGFGEMAKVAQSTKADTLLKSYELFTRGRTGAQP